MIANFNMGIALQSVAGFTAVAGKALERISPAANTRQTFLLTEGDNKEVLGIGSSTRARLGQMRSNVILLMGNITMALADRAEAAPVNREEWENNVTHPGIFAFELVDTFGPWVVAAGLLVATGLAVWNRLRVPTNSYAPAFPLPGRSQVLLEVDPPPNPFAEELSQMIVVAEEGVSGESALELSAADLVPAGGDVESLVAVAKAVAEKLTPPQPPPIPEIPGAPEISGFTIVRELGHGAMGVVYEARSTELESLRFAVKVLLNPEGLGAGETPETTLDRFKREAEAMSKIDHPNVVRVQQYGHDDQGKPYMVLEFLEGGTLADWMKNHPPKPESMKELEIISAEMIMELLDGLVAMSEAGLVHRDIKPDNVFLDRKGKPKLGDLGLARPFNEDVKITKTGIVVGTLLYMPPEQVRGAKLDIRADIHALGATLFKMLSGGTPYEKEKQTLLELVNRVAKGPLNDPRDFNPDISDEITNILLKALAKGRENRYQTPAEFREALKAFVEYQRL